MQIQTMRLEFIVTVTSAELVSQKSQMGVMTLHEYEKTYVSN